VLRFAGEGEGREGRSNGIPRGGEDMFRVEGGGGGGRVGGRASRGGVQVIFARRGELDEVGMVRLGVGGGRRLASGYAVRVELCGRVGCAE